MKEVYPRWPIRQPHAYVRKIAVRVYFRRCEKAKREREAIRPSLDHESPQFLEAEIWHILELVRALPPKQREVMAWTIDEYTPSEIAKLTGQTAATVRSHLRHARHALGPVIRQVCDRREVSDGPGPGAPP